MVIDRMSVLSKILIHADINRGRRGEGKSIKFITFKGM